MPQRQLKELAFARSGDKGDVSNIGLLARDRDSYEILRETLSEERIKDHFGEMVQGEVELYPMDNIEAINVVLRRALGGGATCTTRWDQTGKSMGQALLRMTIEI